MDTSVLVLNTERQAGLAIVRSLGRRGVTVVAGGSSSPTIGMLSQHSDGRYVHPSIETDPAAFVEHLVAYLDRTPHDIVFGPTDQMTYLLSKHADKIETTGTTAAVADWESFRTVFDKAQLFDQLTPVDVPCPETHAPASLAAVESIAPALTYPRVIKPRSKTVWTDSGYSIHLVDDQNYVTSPRELVTTYRAILDSTPAFREWPPIVQEYVPGETTTTVALADDGDIRVDFQERRIRTVPPSGGSSSLLGAVDDNRMREYAARVLESFNWSGPAQVEFMQRPDGEYVLIEVNGRYWGSLPFAINCGVDIPWYHYRQLQGNPVTAVDDYRTDIRQRRTSEDIKWLLTQLQDRNVSALIPFLADLVRANHTFVSMSDPLPTVWVIGQALLDVIDRETDSDTTATTHSGNRQELAEAQ